MYWSFIVFLLVDFHAKLLNSRPKTDFDPSVNGVNIGRTAEFIASFENTGLSAADTTILDCHSSVVKAVQIFNLLRVFWRCQWSRQWSRT